MKRLLAGLLVCVSGLIVPAVSAQDAATYAPSSCPFEVIEPEIEGQTIICGSLRVPESRSGLSANTIDLPVVILKNFSDQPGVPLFYFEGGPGGSAIAGVSFWQTSVLRDRADLILMEQRGTGYSNPTLNCTEYDDTTLEADADLDGLCYARLVSEGIVLDAYTSAETANDFADLVDLLQLDSVDIYGISYGTRMVLTILRDHPQHVRAAIIDGVYPQVVDAYNEEALNGVRAFEVLFADCASSPTCSSMYPDLEGTLLTMIDDLNAEPMTGTDEYGDEVTFTGDDVINELFSVFYDTASIPYIPAMIVAAAERDYETYSTLGPEDAASESSSMLDMMSDDEFDAYVADYLGYATVDEYLAYSDTLSDDEYYALVDEVYIYADGGFGAEESTVDDDSEGAFNNIECYEELPFNTYDAAADLVKDVPPSLATALLYGTEAMFATCDTIWQVTPAGSIEDQAVSSDIPTLVMSGQYDPVTPPAWGDAAAKTLPNSYVYTFPGMGHGAIETLPCPTDIALQFLDDPTREPDAGCITEMTAPDFYTGQ